MNKTGIIFDIQRFSVNDGEGIRTTIFLKGCSLRCQWCHNPESISPRIQLNHNPKKCTLCGKCIKYVDGDGIEIIDNKLSVDFNKHDQSFELTDICLNKAYGSYGKVYTSDEIVDVVMKDKDYYKNSNGGVTFSGGEAINQLEFIAETSMKLKKLGIHICLDISGYNPNKSIEKTIDFVDEYLLDYKLTEEEKYLMYIEKRFDFYKTIDILYENNKSVILRCPIIPKVNDTNAHLKAICDISNKYPNIRIVDILPYHNMIKSCNFKYINNHRKFQVPTKEDKLVWRDYFKANGLKNGILDNEEI